MKIFLATLVGVLVGLGVLWFILRTRQRRIVSEQETKLSLSEMVMAMRPEEDPRRSRRRSSRRSSH